VSPSYDVAVVGGGIVGLATAYQLWRRYPGLRLAVLEKEAGLATHQSGRNSGVVHAGLYYRPGSLKARLCREGKAELEEFAADRGIPYRRCGKLIVAVRPSELTRLASLAERAMANGIRDVRQLEAPDIPDVEPHATGLRALHSPGTGVIDYAAVAGALGALLRAGGCEVLTGSEVREVRRARSGHLLRTARGEVRSRWIVACPGLQADRVAAMTGARRNARIVPFRGGYLTLRSEARHLVRGLIYPVPDPELPFLGIHLTRRVDGTVLVGPNAILALSREGYGLGSTSARDVVDLLTFGGFWRLAARHVGRGLREALHELLPRTVIPELRRYVPGIAARDLRRGPAGIRAQLVDRRGALVEDFVLHQGDGVLHVVNAPSPAATASLAIGRFVADRAGDAFGLGFGGRTWDG
jgi:(S)-2-hydroxyglutarate dehydrogenase